MVKRIDLFMPVGGDYGVWHYITEQLFEALRRQGVECRLLQAKKNDPGPFLKALAENPPECTLSVNGLLPDDQGRFFCDMIRIPHVAFIVGSPNLFLPLTRSERSYISCIDRTSVEFFNGVGYSRSFFVPQGADKNLTFDPSAKRTYGVVMLSSFIDYEAVRASWKKKYSEPLRAAMEEAAEAALNDYLTPYYIAFVHALDRQVSKHAGIDPQKLDFVDILDQIELYIRGKDRVELLKAIDEAKVDVFGLAEGLEGWKKYLGNKRNIVIHDAVPFAQAIEIMKHSKIVLNSSPWIKYGGHERIFTGLAAGALVLTNENLYLREHFQDGKSILFYHPYKWGDANHRINEYLADPAKRERVAIQGRNIVMQHHTWDHRAAQLIKEITPLLAP